MNTIFPEKPAKDFNEWIGYIKSEIDELYNHRLVCTNGMRVNNESNKVEAKREAEEEIELVGDRVHVLSKQRKPLYTGRVRRIQQNGDVVIGDFEGEGPSNNQPELVMSPSDLVLMEISDPGLLLERQSLDN